MDDLDIIRHEPGSSPGLEPGMSPAAPPAARQLPRAAEPDHGLCSPAVDRGRAAQGRGAAGLMSYDIQIFRESAAGLRSPRPGCRV